MAEPCPNGLCQHSLHDMYDSDDPYPTCCTKGCTCGQPGEATLTRHDDGTVTVDQADHLIKVNRELLRQAEPWAWDGNTLQLDTAGRHRYRYRYRYVRPWRDPESGVDVFARTFGNAAAWLR